MILNHLYAGCLVCRYRREDMQTCITWGLSDYSDEIKTVIVINQLSSCVDTLIRFHPLRFDTLYYVALWLREKNGAWRKPTINSRDTVRTGRPYRQVVTLFESQSQEPDTVTVFNGNVRLWKDDRHTYGTMITDTLESVELEKIPEGMIVVGRPFRFRNCFPFPPLNIVISVDSVPSEYSIHDVRIYRGTSGKTICQFHNKYRYSPQNCVCLN